VKGQSQNVREVREYDHEKEWGDQPTVRFVPDHILSEVAAVLLLLSLYTVLAIFMHAGLDIKADPAITPEGSKPEWYFLFLYAFLHFVSPLVGTLVPVVGIVFLVLIPWIDRNPEKKLSKRKLALVLITITMIGIIALSILGEME